VRVELTQLGFEELKQILSQKEFNLLDQTRAMLATEVRCTPIHSVAIVFFVDLIGIWLDLME